MRIVIWLLSNMAAISVALWMVPGLRLDVPGAEDWTDRIVPVMALGAILGLVTTFVAPIVKALSLPFVVLTIGLFLFVVNALMLMLTGWLAREAGLQFEVDGFWPALLGGLVITIVTGFIRIGLRQDED